MKLIARNHRLLAASVWVAALAALTLAPTLGATEAEERWYVVRFHGHHAGWMREKTVETADRVTSESAMHLAIKRGPFTVTMDMASTFVETAEGKPISAVTTQKMAAEEMEKRITFTHDGVEVVTLQGGREDREKLPAIGRAWLTPGAADRYVQQQLAAGAKTIRFHTLDPTVSLEPFEVVIEPVGETVVEVFGRRVPALQVSVTMSNLPGARMTEYADAEGQTLKSTMDFGGIAMEVLAADKALAMAQLDPPELVASTLVKPSFALRRPREQRLGAYRLSVDEGAMPDLAASAVQRVGRIDERTLGVWIDLDSRAACGDEAPRVRNNTMLAGDDAEIVKLAAEATRDAGADRAGRAEAMRRFVSGYIHTADLSVGMGSASEVARTRTGDCTEHAALLAAMLQADGIPARTASGLIYVDEFIGERHIFGYHMWTQAWVGGRWVDLDATLEDPFDAAHILLSTSHMDGKDDANEMVTMAPLMGRLRIDLAE